MAMVKEWQEEIKGMTPGVRREKLEAVKRLLEWKFFDEEYGRDGFRHLRILLEQASEENKTDDSHGTLTVIRGDK